MNLTEMRERAEALRTEMRELGAIDEPTEDNIARFEELAAELEGDNGLLTRIETAEQAERQRAESIARMREVAAEPVIERATPDGVERVQGNGTSSPAVVRSEPTTYGPHSEASYLTDLFRAQMRNDRDAWDRLNRHGVELERDGALDGIRRDVATGNVASLVPPQYLVDMFAEALRAGRPLLNMLTRMDLPAEGMTVYYPANSQATTVAVQASENASVSETDFQASDKSVPIRTFAGTNDLSVQAVERGRNMEQLVFADLAADYAAKTDSSVINDDGTSGTHEGILASDGINAITYTDASPTGAELMLKIWDAIQQIQTNRYAGPDLIVMHPRRWAWLASQADTTGRPLVLPVGNSPFNAQGIQDGVGYGGVVGSLAGIGVVTDANVPTNLGAGTNEDRIIVCRRSDLLWWEEASAPRTFTFEATKAQNLSVTLVARGFSAFTAERRPESVSVIAGTGLVAPQF